MNSASNPISYFKESKNAFLPTNFSWIKALQESGSNHTGLADLLGNQDFLAPLRFELVPARDGYGNLMH